MKKRDKEEKEDDKTKSKPPQYKRGSVNGQFRGRDGSANPAKVDEAILSMKTYCRGRAGRLLGATGQDGEKPVLLLGPSLEEIPGSTLLAKVFKDGKIRYNNYCFNAFFFEQNSLLHYRCDMAIEDQSYTREYAEEIRYAEISTFGQYIDTINNPIKCSALPQNEIKVARIEITAGNRTIIAPYRVFNIEQSHGCFNAIDDKNEDAAIRLLSTLAKLCC